MSIVIKNLMHIYSPGSPFEKVALNNVSLTIDDGDFVGMIGHTGSGKSTLVQHLNGLLKPTSGEIYINGKCITDKNFKLSEIRRDVGLVFQYPEYQLFEETVYKDIAYGPTNLGMSKEEIDEKIHEVIKIVGIKEKTLQKSPFELSGGQKRRVAIAGVLAMNPKILILDEPTAGLDPRGRDEILERLKILHSQNNITIILVSHSMEDIAKTVKSIVVMEDGTLKMHASVADVFKNRESLVKMGLDVPQISSVMSRLLQGGIKISDEIFTVSDAKDAIIKYLKEVGKC